MAIAEFGFSADIMLQYALHSAMLQSTAFLLLFDYQLLPTHDTHAAALPSTKEV